MNILSIPPFAGIDRKKKLSILEIEKKHLLYSIKERRITMLLVIAAILIILWILGLVTSTTLSGFLHIILVIAIVIIVLNVIRGRKS